MDRASAVVSCFNSARYLDGCVSAIRQQTLLTQIIVVDDHSQDNTAKIATELGCEVIRHDRIKGLSATRNSGLRAADSSLVAFVDADVTLAPDWLAALLPAVRRGGVAMAGGRLVERHKDKSIDLWRARHMIQDYGSVARTFDRDSPGRLSGFATLAHRDLLVEVGAYDARYGRSYEDVDLSRRLISRGYRLAYEPAAVAHHQRTDTLRSLMASCWSYDHWPEYEAGSYHSARRIAGKMARNVGRAAGLTRKNADNSDYRLIPIDVAMIAYHSWWDARYYLANCDWLPAQLRPRHADLGNRGRP